VITEGRILREIVILLAGREVEALATGVDNPEGADSDWHQALQLGAFLADAEELDAVLQWLRLRARGLVSVPRRWDRVQALAAALEEKETLKPGEANRVLCEVWLSADRGSRTANRRGHTDAAESLPYHEKMSRLSRQTAGHEVKRHGVAVQHAPRVYVLATGPAEGERQP